MFKRSIALLVCSLIPFLYVKSVSAGYVLPYPSAMPGNTFYKISRAGDALRRWWYWGHIGIIKYRLQLSDKYLVEAKTLNEYGQYLLARDALMRSNSQISYILPAFHGALDEKKDMSRMRVELLDAMDVHSGVLTDLEIKLPHEYIWQPEREKPTSLKILELLELSKKIRADLKQKLQDEITK